MGNYRVVDLRGRFCPGASSWGNSSKGYGVVMHYNGPPAPARAWKNPVAWVKFLCDLHSQQGRFAPGWTINGAAYHELIVGRTVYRIRDYAADLPHCGNLAWNRNSLGLHIPIGGNQRPQDAGQGTMITALQRADDHLRAMSKSRSALKGHREVGSSACPGEVIMPSVRNYRQGAQVNPEATPAKPAPPAQSKTIYRVQLGAFSQRSGANRLEAQVKRAGFDAFVTRSGGYYKVQSGAFGVRANAEARAKELAAKGFGSFIDAGKKA